MTIQYFDNGDLACFDGLSFRLDKRTGYYLNAKTHKRLHMYVWEYYNGKVPDGYHVHHLDFDKSHNGIENLVILSQKDHLSLHGNAWSEERKEKQREMLIEKAVPKASQWHKSEAGKEWHKQHYEKMKDRLHATQKFTCEFCGNEFESKKSGAKFCSNKCRAAARRKSGVDDIKKICERCGAEYVQNKYQKSHYCKNCLNTVRWETRRLQYGSSGNA